MSSFYLEVTADIELSTIFIVSFAVHWPWR